MEGHVRIKLGIKLKESLEYVIYDEFDVYAQGDMSIDQEVLIGNIWKLEVFKPE